MNLWPFRFGTLLEVVVFSCLWLQVSSLGSMSSIAVSYGDKGSAFCGLKSDGSHTVNCYGMNSAIIYGTPIHFPFFGLTAGDGFVCGVLMSSSQPYCWGSSSHVEMGVPQPMVKGAQYLEISAGDYHVCGLRKPLTGRQRNTSLVDCWGYNMTNNYVFEGQVQSISAGSQFNCGLFSQNRSVFCWGDETSSQVINMVPRGMRFQKISAGGYHVCGILEGVDSRAVCWGRSLVDLGEELSISLTRSGQGQGNVELAPSDAMLSVVGGKFHACGIKSYDRGVVCWGYSFKAGTRVPSGIRAFEIGAGNYFTCGVVVEKSHMPVCWGVGFPTSLPLPVSPRMCRSTPCPPDFFETSQNGLCKSPDSHVCMPCSAACPPEMYMRSGCNLKSDMLCEYNCSLCSSPECLSNCSSSYSNAASAKRSERFWSLQLPVVIAEIAFAVFFVCIVSITAVLYVRYKLRDCECSSSARGSKGKKLKGSSSHQKEKSKVRPDLEEFKIRRAQMFPYEELERATSGFKEESIVGKGSFSCVFKGVLKDGSVVAVKRAIMYPNVQKNSKEFHTELDLLSRLNHAHLLNLLGYCEEGGERLLVYEYMAHGSLHQHLHGNKVMKEQMDWVRRVTIAVQAARGIEYLHGYAYPVLKPPNDVDALRRIANVACKSVRMRGKDRPSMDKVTTVLERALAQLMGSPCIEQPILPTEVVLGSNRLHKKSSQRSSNRSASESTDVEDQRFEFRAPSWITFPSVTSSQRRSGSEADVEGKNIEVRNLGNVGGGGDALKSLEEEIGLASPREKLFLQHNF
ncbi:hypothetical protein ACSQ67_011025 [Phaseolus vulgaris]